MATTITLINVINAVNTFDENIGSVATKADEQAVLNEVKTKAIKELNDLVNSLNQSSYTKENWTLINTKLEDATKKINNATSQTSVNTLLASAKAYINNVKPLENQASSGCAGSVISTSGILVILFAAVCLFKNKKEDTINSK